MASDRSTDIWTDRPMFALDADLTVYWPDVRPCWEDWGDDCKKALPKPDTA